MQRQAPTILSTTDNSLGLSTLNLLISGSIANPVTKVICSTGRNALVIWNSSCLWQSMISRGPVSVLTNSLFVAKVRIIVVCKYLMHGLALAWPWMILIQVVTEFVFTLADWWKNCWKPLSYWSKPVLILLGRRYVNFLWRPSRLHPLKLWLFLVQDTFPPASSSPHKAKLLWISILFRLSPFYFSVKRRCEWHEKDSGLPHLWCEPCSPLGVVRCERFLLCRGRRRRSFNGCGSYNHSGCKLLMLVRQS